ncbi:hypothetical protein BJ322DRAFT_1099860 [Thelephora terrestris]|uniref:Myb-like domain-containing protein n=1 Tax=Thelephora terrestris TaxID=56493 RepID=A0A9P6L7N9_9AGAM|nr:hypothetical protein BJ322DRAFT_1099860 [Thelephora terrestris]
MASICVDTGQGRVSSKANEIMKNHSAWKTANRERRAQMVAEMEAKKYGKILGSGGATSPPPSTPINPLTPQTAVDGSAPASEPATGDNGFDYSQTMSSSKFNVRVRIGPNGETVIDEESLYVDNSAEQDTHDYTHVEESDTTKFVNSATHSKKLRGSRWSAMETELFYDALSQFGENYELISYVLPGRDRRACKNKFKAEDRRNPARIDLCLKNRVPYDIQTLARMTGKDFSGPIPIIKAPTPLRMVEDDAPTQKKEETPAPRKKSRTPGLQSANDAEEVLGDVDDYEEND